jgi:hypothetical protein
MNSFTDEFCEKLSTWDNSIEKISFQGNYFNLDIDWKLPKDFSQKQFMDYFFLLCRHRLHQQLNDNTFYRKGDEVFIAEEFFFKAHQNISTFKSVHPRMITNL